ncbi:titin homolog [Patella vulgata]|uniref:titin homolog n=1 Tax=Patella vulgata TaxID=6465 RepID=UPI0021805953|nr:titin homolog [Patella vulgata]
MPVHTVNSKMSKKGKMLEQPVKMSKKEGTSEKKKGKEANRKRHTDNSTNKNESVSKVGKQNRNGNQRTDENLGAVKNIECHGRNQLEAKKSPSKIEIEQQLQYIKEKERELEEQLRQQEEEERKNDRGKKKVRNKSGGGGKKKGKDTTKQQMKGEMEEIQASSGSAIQSNVNNNATADQYKDMKNPLKAEILPILKKNISKNVKEKCSDSSEDEVWSKHNKDLLLQQHLEEFRHLMDVQPKRHTEAQIKMERQKSQEANMERQNRELQRIRLASAGSISSGDAVKKKQEFLRKQQEMERKRNQEEMTELQQVGLQKKAKSAAKGKRSVINTSNNNQQPSQQKTNKKTWGPLPTNFRLESSDVVWPEVKPTSSHGNIWSERERKQQQLACLMPKTSNEEEEMIRKALELSEKTAEEEKEFREANYKYYQNDDDRLAKLLVNRFTMESQQLAEFIDSSGKPVNKKKTSHTDRRQQTALLSPPIEPVTQWQDWEKLESPVKSCNPKEKLPCNKQHDSKVKSPPHAVTKEKSKLLSESEEHWSEEEINIDEECPLNCSNLLETHQEMMDTENRSHTPGLDARGDTNVKQFDKKGFAIDQEYYDPHGGARPKYSPANSIWSPPKIEERNSAIRDNNICKEEPTIKTFTDTSQITIKEFESVNRNNSNNCETSCNNSAVFHVPAKIKVETHPLNFSSGEEEDWNDDINYVGPECDPDEKATHLTYACTKTGIFTNPQVVSKLETDKPTIRDLKEEIPAKTEQLNNNIETQSKYINNDIHNIDSTEIGIDVPMSNCDNVQKSYWEVNYASSEIHPLKTSRDIPLMVFEDRNRVSETQLQKNISGPKTDLDERNNIPLEETKCANSFHSPANIRNPGGMSKGIRFMSARKKFADAKSQFLSSKIQSNSLAESRVTKKQNSFPAYPKSLSSDSDSTTSKSDTDIRIPTTACAISQSRISAMQKVCKNIQHPKRTEEQAAQSNSGEEIKLPSTCASTISYPNNIITSLISDAVKETVLPTKDKPLEKPAVKLPLGLPPHLVNAYLLFLQQQEASKNNITETIPSKQPSDEPTHSNPQLNPITLTQTSSSQLHTQQNMNQNLYTNQNVCSGIKVSTMPSDCSKQTVMKTTDTTSINTHLSSVQKINTGAPLNGYISSNNVNIPNENVIRDPNSITCSQNTGLLNPATLPTVPNPIIPSLTTGNSLLGMPNIVNSVGNIPAMNSFGNLPVYNFNMLSQQLPMYYPSFNPFIKTVPDPMYRMCNPPVFMHSVQQQQQQQGQQQIKNQDIILPSTSVDQESGLDSSSIAPKPTITNTDRLKKKLERLHKVKSLMEEVRKDSEIKPTVKEVQAE